MRVLYNLLYSLRHYGLRSYALALLLFTSYLAPLAAQDPIDIGPQIGSIETVTPIEQVRESVRVLQDMQKDSGLRRLLDEARGVFVVPDYGSAALIIGAAGGEGVLLVKEQGEWARPGFYDIGSLSAGIQAGVTAGSIAMVLLSEQALDAFRENSNFSLTLDAGLSLVDWSARASGELGQGNDVVVWSDMEGLFAALTLGINNISWDDADNEQYYGQATSPQAILAGAVPDPYRQMLQHALREPLREQ